MKEMQEQVIDMRLMRESPNPRGGRRVGSAVWFDVVLGLPLGLRLDTAPSRDAVGVSEVLEGGSAALHNQKYIFEDDAQNFIQAGDRLMTVNGLRCNTQEEAVAIITSARDPQKIKMKFSRERLGFVQVVFPPPATPMTVQPRTLLTRIAEAAGHQVAFECTNGSCGSCWHVNERSGEVYVLCQDCLAGEIPSRVKPGADTTFVFAGFEQDDQGPSPDFDNTEPLILRPCPETYQRARAQWEARQQAG